MGLRAGRRLVSRHATTADPCRFLNRQCLAPCLTIPSSLSAPLPDLKGLPSCLISSPPSTTAPCLIFLLPPSCDDAKAEETKAKARRRTIWASPL